MANKYSQNMTKDELLRLLEIKDEEIAGQQETISHLQEDVRKISASGAGWLIETPNPLYNGRTLGVQFAMGQAFLPDNIVVRSVVVEPMKETTLMQYPEAEQISIREREAIPTSQRAAEMMSADYGYKITHFDGSDSSDEEIKKIVNERTQEYARALQVAEAKEKALRSMAPASFMTGG